MIEVLWRKHYHPGVTGSFHGDMAHAFKAMLADSDCWPETARKMWVSIRLHMGIERDPRYRGERKWFTEAFSKQE